MAEGEYDDVPLDPGFIPEGWPIESPSSSATKRRHELRRLWLMHHRLLLLNREGYLSLFEKGVRARVDIYEPIRTSSFRGRV